MTSEGDVLNDRYRLDGQLGIGGMGTVWRATDLTLERTVAVKELVHLGSDQLSARRDRAVREARALARVNHPAIVRIHDVLFKDRDPWIVMEFIEGQSLAAIIRGTRRLAEREIARIGLEVLRGLSAAHDVDVVHRDVKPSNILVARDRRVFLVDFGIAKISGDLTMTEQSRVMGTPEYLAPEQIAGQQVDAAADLWGLGITFFQALEGYSPFRREGVRPDAATMMAVLNTELPPIVRQGPLAALTARLLRKEPGQRPSAAQTATILESIAASAPRPEPPRPRPTPPGPGGTLAYTRRLWPDDRQPGGWHARSAKPGATALSEIRERVRKADPRAAAALLMDVPAKHAAEILAPFQAEDAAAVFAVMCEADAHAAGSILRMLSDRAAARVLDYLAQLAPDVPAVLLAGLQPADGAPILVRADVRTAAWVLMQLAVGSAVRLLDAMQAAEAARILERVPPLTVALLLTDSGTLNNTLFALLSVQLRNRVQPYLPRGNGNGYRWLT